MQIRRIWDKLNSSLWFRPVLWALLLGTLAFVLITADRRLDPQEHPLATSGLAWFFVSGVEGARVMLTAVATAVLAVTTLTFSIIMVAVVQTSNAYSPRILHQYLSDSANQHVLGILIGTFVYCMLVLRAIQAADAGEGLILFVPALATNGALLLALISTGAFIFFINHATHSIALSNIIMLILSDTAALIEGRDIFPENAGQPLYLNERQLPSSHGACLAPGDAGYVEFFDANRLMKEATEKDLIIRIERRVGDYVLPDVPLLTVWPREAVGDELRASLLRGVQLANRRSLVQDLLYGIIQLSDVAIRALSAAVNDPSTAVNCIDALSLLVHKFAAHGPITPYRGDEDGNLRLIAPVPDFDLVLDLALGRIRHYGAGDLEVTVQLFKAYDNLNQSDLSEDERQAIWRQAVLLMEAAGSQMELASDRMQVNELFRRTATGMERDPAPYLLSPTFDRSMIEEM